MTLGGSFGLGGVISDWFFFVKMLSRLIGAFTPLMTILGCQFLFDVTQYVLMRKVKTGKVKLTRSN